MISGHEGPTVGIKSLILFIVHFRSFVCSNIYIEDPVLILRHVIIYPVGYTSGAGKTNGVDHKAMYFVDHAVIPFHVK